MSKNHDGEDSGSSKGITVDSVNRPAIQSEDKDGWIQKHHGTRKSASIPDPCTNTDVAMNNEAHQLQVILPKK